jgi:ABC-type multidrug transport system ATPase subunit
VRKSNSKSSGIDTATPSSRDAPRHLISTQVQASLDALIRKGDSTVVLVAHRLSTVMNADKIAVIADGGVKEEGSHDELCAKGGVYAGLVRKQLTKAAAVLDQGKEDAAEAKAANDTIDKLLG